MIAVHNRESGDCLWGPYTVLDGGGEIAHSLASLSVKRAARVRAQLDPLVTERRDSITVLLTRSHQCRLLVKKGHPCVIMSV